MIRITDILDKVQRYLEPADLEMIEKELIQLDKLVFKM